MKSTTSAEDDLWSSSSVRSADQTDALQQAMSSVYRPIEITRRLSAGFSSTLRTREIDGLSLVECQCDPCSGRRDRSAIGHALPSFGIQIIQSGVEQICFGTECIIAHPGDVIAWRSDIPYAFDVLETMRKTTLIVPWSEVASRIPRAGRFLGARTTSATGVGLLVDGLLQQLIQRMDELRVTAGGTGLKGIFLAASAALADGTAQGDDQSLADTYLAQVQQYILGNLHDNALTIEKVASSQRISVRYLHKLFEKTDCSVSSYIAKVRLSRCREAFLDRRNRRRNVMEIASMWGYNDPSTFSKAFKREFDVSPTRFRSDLFEPAGSESSDV